MTSSSICKDCKHDHDDSVVGCYTGDICNCCEDCSEFEPKIECTLE